MDQNNYNNGMYENTQPSQADLAHVYELKQQQERENKKGLAIASLVFGILALTICCCVGFLPGIVAIILGIISLAMKRGGKGMAISGIVTGAIALIISIVMLTATLLPVMGLLPYIVEATEGMDPADPNFEEEFLERLCDIYYEDNGEYPFIYHELHMDEENWYEEYYLGSWKMDVSISFLS